MIEALLKSALLGVDKDLPPALDGPVGALLTRVADGADAALDFSRHAGVLAACTRAAVTLDSAAVTLPAASPADTQALAAAHPWRAAVGAIFSGAAFDQGYETRLKHEACLRLAKAGATLPFALLPQALDAGQRNQRLRAVLLPVLGQRGRWLAAQNPDWKFAAGMSAAAQSEDDPRVWQEGNHLERLAWFGRLRARDAQAARELLQAGLGELAAKERGEFAAVLAIQLQAGDTPLLETLLAKDRSRDLRHTAARLLALLPDSAHAQRLAGWLAPLLSQKRGLLSRSWKIEAPEAADPAWASAAVDAARPQHEALGERAWWLYQLVRQAPLGWWTAQTGMNPADLVAWSSKTDWKDALQRGWRERVSAAEPDWIEALLSLRTREARASANELLALLPVARREKHWASSVDALWKDGTLSDIIAACAPGETLSADYSKPLFASMTACFEDDRLRHDYGLRGCLLELVALVHPAALREARTLPRRADETPAMAECAQRFEHIVRARAALHA
jgi:Family of unknown function (DUF5691)